MPQSLSAVFVHLVWSTKDRKPWLRDPAVRTRLHAYLGGVSREMQRPPVIAGGVDDHVHILGQLGREVSIAGWVKELKRVSSIWMKDVDTEFKGFYWQGGYGRFPSAHQTSRAWRSTSWSKKRITRRSRSRTNCARSFANTGSSGMNGMCGIEAATPSGLSL